MLTHINTYVIIPNKSTAISVKKRFCAVLFPAKIYRPATHPIILPSVSPDKILRLYCVGGIFFLGKPYLENFMSRPSVIPAFRPTPLQNRGRNFVRSKRRSTYTSSGTLYLFLRLNNSETFVELVGTRPLHLLSQTVLSLKHPTGVFVAFANAKALSEQGSHRFSAFVCVHQPDGFKDLFAGDFCCRRLFILPGLRCCRGQVLGIEVP